MAKKRTWRPCFRWTACGYIGSGDDKEPFCGNCGCRRSRHDPLEMWLCQDADHRALAMSNDFEVDEKRMVVLLSRGRTELARGYGCNSYEAGRAAVRALFPEAA